MKYAIVIPDGCADEPQDSLDGRTPLEAAQTPAMDRIARLGVVGNAHNVPQHLPAGSDVANLSLFGYDPNQYFTGRAPLEAAAQGIELAPGDWAIRCNLVTVVDQTMKSFTAGQISNDEARLLIDTLNENCSDEACRYVPGVSYRNLLLYRPGKGAAPFTADTWTRPPHDLTDKSVLDDYPRGPGSDLLHRLMSESVQCLADHQVNRRRREAGHLPATNVWLWGQGKAPSLPRFDQRHGVRGAMITAVDLLRGLAALIGWQRIDVPGATGYTDTDYAAKGRHAVAALDEVDLICVHVEATDEASHEGDIPAKIRALESIDRDIVAPLHAALQEHGDYRILVTPDHPTPVRTKTHSHAAVPWTIAGTGIEPDGRDSYGDQVAAQSDLTFPAGWKLMNYFLQRR